MDDRRINTFLTIVRSGSLSKASLELNCTQPAVTQLINSMEDELGCKLFERTYNGVHLTPSGQTLYPYMVQLKESYQQLMDQASLISKGAKIPIRIGTLSSISTTWLPKQMMRFQSQNITTTFHLIIGSDSLREWLAAGEIDIALGAENVLKEFKCFPLMKDTLYAVLPEDSFPDQDSVTAEDLDGMTLISSPYNQAERYFNKPMTDVMQVLSENDLSLLSLVQQGMGFTILPKLSLVHSPSHLQILPFKPELNRTIVAAIPHKTLGAAKDFAIFLSKNKDSIS